VHGELVGPGAARLRSKATGVSARRVADASCRSASTGVPTKRSRPSPVYTPAMPRTSMPAWNQRPRIKIAGVQGVTGRARRMTMP